MIALVFCGDLNYCPYINRYIERLNYYSKDYCVYFWNRSGNELTLPNNYRYYGEVSELKKNRMLKSIDFLNFEKWLKKSIDEDKPDRIIVLSTLSGILLRSVLLKGKAEYVYDIRDYSYEHIKPFYSIEKKLIENSSFTAISSNGFRAFLPEYNYIIAHNFNRADIKADFAFSKTEGKISFVWNGVMRFFDYQKQYLDALKNDSRFEMIYHGSGPDLKLYQDYCNYSNINNVTFTGAYDNSQKAELLDKAGILNNCYGYLKSAGNKLKYAISNRFYDGIIYHIPQVVEPEGYKHELAKKYGIGVAIKISSNFADELFNYYNSIDVDQFNNACSTALSEVLFEDNEYIENIDLFIKG